MCHGDDAGLRLPPALAPTQVVVVLVRAEDGAGEAAATLRDELVAAGVRTSLDDRLGTSFGRRSVEWELKGVPLRVEVGPRELADGVVTLVERHRGTKTAVALAEVADRVGSSLIEGQRHLLAEATRLREERTVEVGSTGEAAEAAGGGFARVPWSVVGAPGEAALADKGVSVRCLQRPDGGLPSAEEESASVAVIGRAY